MKISLQQEKPTIPLEEIVTRTNPWAGEFSPSSLETASCYRKFFFEKILGITPDIPATALIFGVCIHKGTEAYLKHKPLIGHKQAAIQGLKAFAALWQKYGLAGDIKRNFNVGVLLLDNYFKVYENDNAEFVPELIECEQWIALPNSCRLLLKIDRVKKDGNYYTVVDTKTTSMALTDYYFRSYENALPTSIYFWAVAEILGQCDCVQIDAIRVPMQESLDATFVRKPFIRTEIQIRDAINTCWRRSDEILSKLRCGYVSLSDRLDQFFCNQHNCNDYSGCPFKPLCMQGFKHPALLTEYKFNNPIGTKIFELAQEERYEDIYELTIEESTNG